LGKPYGSIGNTIENLGNIIENRWKRTRSTKILKISAHTFPAPKEKRWAFSLAACKVNLIVTVFP
jgi:hypothetical protein